MPFDLSSAPEREHSQWVGFSGNRIDRQSENRTETALQEAFEDARLRIMLARAGRLHLKAEGEGFGPYFSLAEARDLSAKLEHAVLLGMAAEGPVVMAPAGLEAEALPVSMKAIDYRSIHAQGLLSPDAMGELAQGAALLAWHASHRFCGRCGGPTQMRIGGYKRSCENCGADHFPRTDPVAIMLAVRDDQCLLGRSPHFPPGMYSALAGFIEPGETIEAAVRRETLEEAGIRLGRVVYHASQPWPFPYSLMIGCYGEALNEDVAFDARELEDCRWFAREEVRLIVTGTHPDGIIMPPRGAIANRLISYWAGD
jgi:NAD+ diphosphatase